MPKVSSQHGEKRCWRKRYYPGWPAAIGIISSLSGFARIPSRCKQWEAFLAGLVEEAGRRSYDFDVTKILEPGTVKQIEETEGPLLYELAHLREKLHRRLRIFTGSFGLSLSANLIHYSASPPGGIRE
jgi:hypothetical protein